MEPIAVLEVEDSAGPAGKTHASPPSPRPDPQDGSRNPPGAKCGTAGPIADGPVESTSRVFSGNATARRFGAAGLCSPAQGQRANASSKASGQHCRRNFEHRDRELRKKLNSHLLTQIEVFERHSRRQVECRANPRTARVPVQEPTILKWSASNPTKRHRHAYVSIN